MTDLDSLIPANSGWVLYSANGINDHGQIVGQGAINGQEHAFLWDIGPGAPIDLGVLKGGTQSYATAINDNGHVTGYSDTSKAPYDAFRWDPSSQNGTAGAMTDLGGLKTVFGVPVASRGLGLNNSGQVVGFSQPVAGGSMQAVLWSGKSVTDLTAQIPGGSGWTGLAFGNGINDTGVIVGQGELLAGASYVWHGFLLTPSSGGKTMMAAATTTSTSTASTAGLLAAIDGNRTTVVGAVGTLFAGTTVAPASVSHTQESASARAPGAGSTQPVSANASSLAARDLVIAQLGEDMTAPWDRLSLVRIG
jgi:probable HAF family extracellular repeat protein